jgi:phosphatidylserine/phosphatidylglycerophosphate/cardiolipin synthase-like enzyme
VFGVKKLEDETYDPWAVTLNYPDSFIELWFSPGTTEESLKPRVLDLISSSTKSIDIMMWELTTDEIPYDLVAKAKEGVRVRVIASEARVTKKDSSIPYMQSVKVREGIDNLEIVLDTKLSRQSLDKLPDNFSPFIHHHMMIVDGKTLVMGSGNWSLWGFYHNDENALVTNNTYLISESQKTFDYFYEVLK